MTGAEVVNGAPGRAGNGQPDEPGSWELGGRTLDSRLIVGTGGAPSLDVLGRVIAASGPAPSPWPCGGPGRAGPGHCWAPCSRPGCASCPTRPAATPPARRCSPPGWAARRSAPTGSSWRSWPMTTRCSRTRGAAAGRAPARRGRVHRPSLHQRRPGPRPAAGRRGMCGGDAAGGPDRLGTRHPQSAQHRDDRGTGWRPRDPRRRDRHGQRRGVRDGAGLRRGPRRVGHHPGGRPGADGLRDAAGGAGRARRPGGRAHHAPLARGAVEPAGGDARRPA